MIKKNISSDQGFSLVETLVVTALVGVVGLGVASLVSQVWKQMASAQLAADRNSLQNQLENIFRKPALCHANLVANGFSLRAGAIKTDFAAIKEYDPTGTTEVSTVIPATGVPVFPNSKLQVASMQLTSPSSASNNPVLVKNNTTVRTYLGSLRVTFTTPKGEVTLKPIVIPSIVLHTDGSRNLQDCLSTRDTAPPRESCEDVMGLEMSGTGTCLPTSPEAKRSLCAELGGSQPAVCITRWCWQPPWYCKLPSALKDFSCPDPNQVIVGYSDGMPICQTPAATPTWSRWTRCSPSPGPGTRTRTCLLGICDGPTVEDCVSP